MNLWSDFLANDARVIHKWKHYFPAYERHFRSFVYKPLTFIEIGCGLGGSLQMWKRYFGPYARIIGIDVLPECKAFEEDQIEVRIGRQQDQKFLQSVLDEFGAPDIVLDDGSHMMSHVVASFESLYPQVAKNGIYMVEDLHTAYWEEFEGGLHKPSTFIELCKTLIDELNADHTREALPATEFTKTTLSMHFYDSIAVFEKGSHTKKWAPRIGNDIPVVPSKTLEPPPDAGGAAILVAVYPFRGDGYSEEAVSTQTIKPGGRATLVFDFPQGLGAGRLRLDPADRPCIVELGAISISSKESSTLLWSATKPSALRRLELSGTAMALPDENKCLLLSYGHDPQIILPMLENGNTALRVEISLKLDVGADAMKLAVDALQAACLAAEAQTVAAEAQTAAAEAQTAAAEAQTAAAEAQTAAAQSLAANLRIELHAAQAERMLVAAELARVASQKNELRRELASVRRSLELEQKIRWGMEHSRSWRITKPMRSLMFAVRGKPRTEVSK